MAELKALSKLKMAGKLHYWRGTIEIDERELHTICDEIQAEYDKAVAAMNKAAGNWAKADSRLRESYGKVPELGERENEGVRESYSRWHELFGSPERAARTLARMCAIGDGSCAGCSMYEANLEHCKSDYTHLKSIVEWLRGDA